METKENLLYLFWNCSLVKQFWFAVGNLLMMCGIVLPLTAREITLGISESLHCPINIKPFFINLLCLFWEHVKSGIFLYFDIIF
jgi:hypothetical protein